MTEQELVAKARAGNQEAFAQLVLANQNRVYALCVRLTGDREEGADLAQEAFLKAWQGLPAFKGESSFSTWIYRLTNNLCIDFLRRQRRRQTVQPVVLLEDERLNWPEPADPTQNPQRQLEAEEVRQALARCLDALPEHHRHVLVMREMAELSYEEIAHALGVGLGTVKSRIVRARMALRTKLLQDGNFSDLSPSNSSEEPTRR